MQFIFLDTPVTLKQSQGHQTYNKNVDPSEQGYTHAKFERSRFNSVQEKGNVEVSFKSGNRPIISLELTTTKM